MKERPILFSAPMVRAILAGTKTQTRRIVKLEGRTVDTRPDGTRYVSRVTRSPQESSFTVPCPYGAPGDRLWVRETVRWSSTIGAREYSVFGADGKHTTADAWPWQRKVLPGIHMPRGLSRITLEITEVRVQRLRDISESDVLAEGVDVPLASNVTGTSWSDIPDLFTAWRLLWDHINGERASWLSNPWVWALTFKRVEAA